MTGQDFITLIVKYKKVIFAIIASLGLLFSIFYVIMVVRDYNAQSKLEKQRTEVNTLLQESTNINSTISNLEQKKIEAEANSNQAILDLHRVQDDVNKAQENSNRSAEAVNKVETANYNTISVQDANKSRCRAFPNDIGC